MSMPILLNQRWNLWQPICIATAITYRIEAFMGGPAVFRKALLVGGALAATIAGANWALAQEAEAPPTVQLNDPTSLTPETPALDLSVREDVAVRFTPNTQGELPAVQGPRRLELELAAGGGDSPLDVSVAQRATFGSDSNGDLDRRGSGSEVRVGRGLVGRSNNNNQGSSVYAFVASDNEALTWRPGARTEFGGSGDAFSLQEQVEVGDMSAGVTYERNGIQASLAYVEREESTQVGHESFSRDTSFTGITVTMRR
jgi:hypothetical protein